jgi:hypothetical protein
MPTSQRTELNVNPEEEAEEGKQGIRERRIC